MTAEGVRLEQDAEVEGTLTVTGENTAVLIPDNIRSGVHRSRFEITWTLREEARDGLPVFVMICNEWAPTAPEVRGTFHLQRKSRGGPYIVLAAELDENE